MDGRGGEEATAQLWKHMFGHVYRRAAGVDRRHLAADPATVMPVPSISSYPSAS